MAITDIIDLIHPAASGVDVILSDTVWILFDREMDEESLSQNIFITGPDFDSHTGPDHAVWLDTATAGDEEEILQSPGFHGIVDGEFSFQRISLTSLSEVATEDTVASGILYRTKAIFTPTHQFSPSIQYTVYVSGDEDSTDGTKTGICTRTIYDDIPGGNTGTVNPVFSGLYTGTSAATYTVRIETTGVVGTATFKFWTNLNPTPSVALRTRRGGTLLSNGVTVSFPEGTFVTGDTWTVLTKVRDTHSGNISWVFDTGSGSIETIPLTTSTSVIGGIIPYTPTASGVLTVSSTSPTIGTSHLTTPTGDYTVSVLFSEALNPSSVNLVTIEAESVDGDISRPASGELITTQSSTGATLSIVIASGQLNDNNLVSVVLGSGINSTSGNYLASDYTFWFTTTYTPYYCTLKKIRLDIGSFISSVSDDTVNMAIHQASISADAMTWNKVNLTDTYYQFVRTQWSCCKASEILLLNATGRDNLKRKKLADLEVEYATLDNVSLDRALSCMEKWENSLRVGGRTVRAPMMFVKGELDPDRPTIGRGWGYANEQMYPVANTRTRSTGSRKYKNTYYSTRYGKKRYDT